MDISALENSKDGIFEIYEEIKTRIVSRKYLANTKLNQNQIAKELGVSRTPVIKALHMLKSQGLVDNTHNKGFYVHNVSLQDTVEIYKIRQAFEMIAVADVIANATSEEIAALADFFEPFREQQTIDWNEYAENDRIFHSRLIELSGNRILQRTNQSVLILPKAFAVGLLRSPKDTLQEHFDLINALANRDVETAQNVARKHLQLSITPLSLTIAGLRKIGVDPQKIPIDDIAIDSINR